MKIRIPLKSGRISCNKVIDKINKKMSKLKDGDYTWEIKEVKKARSLDQNKLYWDILGQVAVQTGMESIEIHESMRATYLVDYSTPIATVGSTTALNTVEFSEYITKIVAHLSQFATIAMPEDK